MENHQLLDSKSPFINELDYDRLEQCYPKPYFDNDLSTVIKLETQLLIFHQHHHSI